MSKVKSQKAKVEGYEGLQDKIRSLKTPKIQTWQNIYPDRDYLITIEIPEFTCICPKTGLPDFAVITVRYIPGKACIELKSLKYYELFYRNLGIFHENVVNKFLEDLVKACRPHWMEISAEFNPRGGVKTLVRAEYGERCAK